MDDEVEWFEDYATGEDFEVKEYDITSTPNDFNITTLFSFIESGAVVIPGFQRHFVWDIRRSSKLIESLILGLPVPQIFLYEQAKNKFLVIDGQQRLMSIYYFLKGRYPKKEKRSELRVIFEEHGRIPDSTLDDDSFFTNFRLRLPARVPDEPNLFDKKSYSTLDESKMQLDLRPIRNVIVKQNSPENDDSSVFEIFSRLNSGGVNLTAQEIRLSLYHSEFYDILMNLNRNAGWRRILGNETPDLHLKDLEVLLRMFAMLVDGDNYTPSMVKFLNNFSRKSQKNSREQNNYLKELFLSFVQTAQSLPEDAFQGRRAGRFSIALIESVFCGVASKAFSERRMLNGEIPGGLIQELNDNVEFQEAATKSSTSTINVNKRVSLGKSILPSL